MFFTFEFLVECENNKQPVVFFENQYENIYTENTKSYFGDYSKTLSSLIENSEYDEKIVISSQYCSFKQTKTREKKWIAEHTDDQHGTFQKLLSAITFFTEREVKGGMNLSSPIAMIKVPLVVLRGDLLVYNFKKEKLQKHEMVRFQLKKINDEYMNNHIFNIDVITESYLKEYLQESKTKYLNMYNKFCSMKNSILEEQNDSRDANLRESIS